MVSTSGSAAALQGRACVLAGAALVAGLAWPSVALARPVNDTGYAQCIDPTNLDASVPVACAGTGQDGEFGRDVTKPNSRNGQLGFSFRKIDSVGNRLPNAAADWACVEDGTTRLMWEVKTTNGGLHDVSQLYTHLGDGRPGDTSSFLTAVNEAGLCGHHDWRLPTPSELQGLVDYSQAYPGPTIDTQWFPNSSNGRHWTQAIHVGNAAYAWFVFFEGGFIDWTLRSLSFPVRLVRDSQ
jgi:Protein of unknown function (DUF1566)